MAEECVCTLCNESLPPDAFRVRKDTGRREARCTKCLNAVHMERYHANPEPYKKMMRLRQLRQFGLDHESYAALLADQGSRCAICRTDVPGGRGGFHVDHDHNTNKVRGLLCWLCNTNLGRIGDREESVLRLLAYLRGDLRYAAGEEVVGCS